MLFYRFEYYDAYLFIRRVHQKSKGLYQKVLYKWIHRFEMCAILQFPLTFSVWVFQLGFVLYGNYVHKEKTLIWATQIPFADVNTLSGYLVLIIYEFTSSFLASFFAYVLDLVFIFFCFTAVSFIELEIVDCFLLKEEILKKPSFSNDVKTIKLTKMMNQAIYNSQQVQVYVFKYFLLLKC